MPELYYATYQSPIGAVLLQATEEHIVSLTFEEGTSASSAVTSQVLQSCLMQLDEYFAGKRKEFSLPLKPKGTVFQQEAWQELLRIPYGSTASYQDIAVAIGRPKAVRAIGSANHYNPIALIIPCHRVIGKNNALTGYAFGVERKKWLLEHEAAVALRRAA